MPRLLNPETWKRIWPIVVAPAFIFVAYNVLLNTVPDPPAVVEGRYRARLYRLGKITEAEFRNPELFRQRQAEKEGLLIKERQEAWKLESERRRKEVDERERTQQWQKEVEGWEQGGKPQETHYDRERRF